MNNSILVDSSFLYALHDKSDKFHLSAARFSPKPDVPLIIPDVVLVEVTHLLNEFIGYHAVLAFMGVLTTSANTQIEAVTMTDLKEAYAIMQKYAESRIDLVDACIFVLADRLNLNRICTFDRRDFSKFRPTHCEYFELLPEIITE